MLRALQKLDIFNKFWLIGDMVCSINNITENYKIQSYHILEDNIRNAIEKLKLCVMADMKKSLEINTEAIRCSMK